MKRAFNFEINGVNFVISFFDNEVDVYCHGVTFVLDYGDKFIVSGKWVEINRDRTLTIEKNYKEFEVIEGK